MNKVKNYNQHQHVRAFIDEWRFKRSYLIRFKDLEYNLAVAGSRFTFTIRWQLKQDVIKNKSKWTEKGRKIIWDLNGKVRLLT